MARINQQESTINFINNGVVVPQNICWYRCKPKILPCAHILSIYTYYLYIYIYVEYYELKPYTYKYQDWFAEEGFLGKSMTDVCLCCWLTSHQQSLLSSIYILPFQLTWNFYLLWHCNFLLNNWKHLGIIFTLIFTTGVCIHLCLEVFAWRLPLRSAVNH